MNPPDPKEAREIARSLAAAAEIAQVPLVVDLDGTLLRTDTLIESLLVLAREHPLDLLKLPFWLASGRAHLKHCLAQRTDVDVHTLPWTQELLQYLRDQKSQGRELVLATGADQKVARAVADEAGVFDAVLASDSVANLTDGNKRDRLVAEFGVRGFDYVGNSFRDVPAWTVARRALLVDPPTGLAAAVARVTLIERTFHPEKASLATYLSAMRAHHWLKNLLLLVPLLVERRLGELGMAADATVAFLCFCLAASGVYLLNDLLDLPADRRHPHKKERALASGRIPLLHALVLLAALWTGAAAISLMLPALFSVSLVTYAALMVMYSLWLKNVAILDTFVLGIGYAIRVLAGSLATGLAASPWLLVSTASLFFGLALLKRYAELIAHRASRVRAYRSSDAAVVAGLGTAACCVAVAVLAIKPIVEPTGEPRWPIWLTCAWLLFWSGHMWLMAHRGNIRGDPVTYALHDRVSLGFGATIGLFLLFAL